MWSRQRWTLNPNTKSQVDLSHVLSAQKGSLVIEVVVSSGYPQVRRLPVGRSDGFRKSP